jgi:phage portal protein BeeE
LQVFSQIRFQWTRFVGSQPSDLFGTQELAVLERPWPGGTTSDLLARMEVDVSLAGNAYVRRTRRDRLNVLRPEYVTIILGSQEDADHPADAADVEVAGYMYRSPSGPPLFLPPNQVAHYAPLPDPFFHFLGMSWITPVIREVQADSLATEHKARFFTNAATPNLAIKFDPSVPKDAILAFKELVEEDHAGAWNAYKTLYLGGGADPVVVGKDFRELDFAATQGKGESRLASAAGVPPSWVGFSEGLQGSALNAGNFNSARRRFSDGTMTHLWANAAASLQAIVTPPDSGASLWFDARVPFMREDAGDRAAIQQREAQTIAALIRDGFTPDSVIAAVNNNDWTLLKHTGLTSVQLQPPSDGTEPIPQIAGSSGGVGTGAGQ